MSYRHGSDFGLPDGMRASELPGWHDPEAWRWKQAERRPDSALNVYLRTLKAIIEDAERELSARDFQALQDILRIVGR